MIIFIKKKNYADINFEIYLMSKFSNGNIYKFFI